MKYMIKQGSITVFLSLLLPLILALIGTLLEAARFHTAKALLTINTEQSMQMMFSDYNKELWQEYHLFAYTEEDKKAEEEIKRGVLASLCKEEEEESLWKGNKFDFWHLELSDLFIDSKEMLTDEDGDILRHEALEYEKYQISEKTIEEILQLLGMIKKTGAAANVAEKKMETEEKLYNYSQDMLEFMEVIDGIDFGKTGVQYYGDKLKVKTSFVKQFFYGNPNPQNLGFKNDIVWESLKNNYYNSKESLENLQKLLELAESACIELKNLEVRLSEIQSYQSRISKEEKREEKELEEELKEKIEEELKAIQKKIKQAEKVKKEFLISWKKESSQLEKKADNIKKCVKTALNMIPKLKESQEAAKESVEEYQRIIEEEKTELFSEMYQSFSEDCKELAASVGLNAKGKEICDFNVFATYLYENERILQEIKSGLFLESSEITQEFIRQKIQKIEELKRTAESYHITEFVFSYKMISEKKKQENPIDALKKLGNTALLSLVVKEQETVSKQDIKGEEKVFSQIGENEFLEGMQENLSEITVENREMFTSLFGKFASNISENISELDSLQTMAQSFLQEILLNKYVQEVFFHAVTEKKNKKISALRYEQEYILAGKERDEDNLSALVKQIIAIRTICNYLSLLSDSSRQKEAYAIAVSLAGFTGLEPLVEVIKTVIMLVFAYEEGMVDMAALLQGKKLPVIKNSSQFSLSFQELLTFGRNTIQHKAESILEDSMGCGYTEYLYLLLYIQKQKNTIYHLEDMIQMNLRMRYEKNFLLENAVFGCKIKADYNLPTVFLKLPFVNIVTGQTKGWHIEIFSEMAY